MTENDPLEEGQMTLIEHLVELRDRIVYSLMAAGLSIVICFSFNEPIWDFLFAPVQEALEESGKGSLAVHSLLEGFMNKIKISALAGIVLASPVISYQAWKYIAPALYPHEKQFVLPLAMASTVLFLMGVCFGYFIIFDFIFSFLLSQSQESVTAVISIDNVLMTCSKLLAGFGLTFQLPVISFFLAKAGLIDHIDMVTFFRYAIVLIFVISAFLTPPDPISQMLMAIPLTVLYLIGIGVAWIFSNKERSEDLEQT